jgi:hypothetical protein
LTSTRTFSAGSKASPEGESRPVRSRRHFRPGSIPATKKSRASQHCFFFRRNG